jgi:hypothetical protein
MAWCFKVQICHFGQLKGYRMVDQSCEFIRFKCTNNAQQGSIFGRVGDDVLFPFHKKSITLLCI